MIKVFAVHTAMAMVEPTTILFKEHLPNVKLNHIADDSLIQEVIAANQVTPMVRKRLINYYFAAMDAGADVIFNTCSSIGEVAEQARLMLQIPLLKIDDPMAKLAVNAGNKIAVLATLPTTLGPTANLIRKMAIEQNKKIEIIEGLAEGAFQALMSGDRAKHDNLILEAAKKVAGQADIIVLAQGSMARMENELSGLTGKKILSSPLSGVLGVKDFLKLSNL
jgi:aspartate/glutamate racemase